MAATASEHAVVVCLLANGIDEEDTAVLLNPERIPNSEKAILAGLYLSKYDTGALKNLGFDSFAEAFNVLGYALQVPPSSIKNYRDEFDPLFDNRRKGWYRCARRENCLRVFEEYGSLDSELFTGLIQSFAGRGEDLVGEAAPERQQGDGASLFAKRLITGLAAERYFEANYRRVPEFQHYDAQNTTRIGCGYDFDWSWRRIRLAASLGIEVKGLPGRAGGLSLTDKEHDAAKMLSNRYYLFVVKNFRESPYHEIFQNPRSGSLRFAETRRTVVQISWLANV